MKLPEGEYTFHDMGLKVDVSDSYGKGDLAGSLKRVVRISGLSTDPIDYWDDKKLEKLYSKLSFLLMKIYETDVSKK